MLVRAAGTGGRLGYTQLAVCRRRGARGGPTECARDWSLGAATQPAACVRHRWALGVDQLRAATLAQVPEPITVGPRDQHLPVVEIGRLDGEPVNAPTLADFLVVEGAALPEDALTAGGGRRVRLQRVRSMDAGVGRRDLEVPVLMGGRIDGSAPLAGDRKGGERDPRRRCVGEPAAVSFFGST